MVRAKVMVIDKIDLCSKQMLFLASGNWGNTTSKRPISSWYRRENQVLTVLSFFFSFISRPVRRNSLNEDVHRTPHSTRTTCTFFSCEPHISSVGTPHWLKMKESLRHSQCVTFIPFLDVVVECSLSSVPTCFDRTPCTVIKTLSVYHIHCKKSAQQPKRTRSLERVLPNARFSPKH